MSSGNQPQLLLLLAVTTFLHLPPSFSFANPSTYHAFHNVVIHSCYDGDTCTFTFPGLHPLFGDHIVVQLRGIDSPEIRGKCEPEKRKAIEARDFLRARLRAATRIDLLDADRGK